MNNNSNNHSRKVAIIGLGYVGLPVAVALAKVNHVVGFDIDCDRINQLKAGHDYTGEVEDPADLHNKNLVFTYKPEEMADCNFYIVAVPTPVDEAKIPDLHLVYLATETVGKVLKKGDIVVYESTVLSGHNRRGMRPNPGESFRAYKPCRFHGRVQSGKNQPWR